LKIRFIVNPRSGHLRHRPDVIARVREWAAPRGAEVLLTERAGHASELAAAVAGDPGQVAVAVGGDGTMNEVARALVHKPASLGLVPCGSGNALARHLGVPMDCAGALRVLTEGAPRVIDSGLVEGIPFFNSFGLGFEAEIAERFAHTTNRGLTGYMLIGTKLYFSHRPERCVIHHDGGRLELDAFTLGVFNTGQYGNDALIAPAAEIDDGRLDLVAVPPTNLLKGAGYMWRMFRGSIGGVRSIRRAQSARFVIERAAPGWIHADGEPHRLGARLEVSVRPASLRVIAPPAG
jgi:YegS/Rv2252/BmrU family lipid kinase